MEEHSYLRLNPIKHLNHTKLFNSLNIRLKKFKKNYQLDNAILRVLHYYRTKLHYLEHHLRQILQNIFVPKIKLRLICVDANNYKRN